MYIHEVCKACRLTKKAIEYYVEQGLVSPSVLENGYRCFSEEDVARLKKVAILRGLGLSVSEIRKTLDKQDVKTLREFSDEKEREIAELREKQTILEKLAQDGDWEEALSQLAFLEKKLSVSNRLLALFPGTYGQYISLHFASYLNKPIVTREQQEAFETVIAYLDGANLVIPDDLTNFLNEVGANFRKIDMTDMTHNLSEAVKNPEQYLADRKETIELYLAYQKSEEYRNSPDFRLKELLTKFQAESGYNAVFIPAMKRLSNSYQKYHDALTKANEIFLKAYGDAFDG